MSFLVARRALASALGPEHCQSTACCRASFSSSSSVFGGGRRTQPKKKKLTRHRLVSRGDVARPPVRRRAGPRTEGLRIPKVGAAARTSRFVELPKTPKSQTSEPEPPLRRSWDVTRSTGEGLTAQAAFARRQQQKLTSEREGGEGKEPESKKTGTWESRREEVEAPPRIVMRPSKFVPTYAPRGLTYPLFTSPPLLPGLLKCVKEHLGGDRKPFMIQSMIMDHFFTSDPLDVNKTFALPSSTQTLIASETGSGKTLAYLLPLIQFLKATDGVRNTSPTGDYRPRGLVLAPTHELCRQVTAHCKSLTHEVKLRTTCLSNPPTRASAKQMEKELEAMELLGATSKTVTPADIIVATPSRIVQLAALRINTDDESPRAAARTVKADPRSRSILDLSAIEWLVVDEADVVFDRDFRQTIFGIIDAIRKAKRPENADTESAPAEVGESWELPSKLPFNLVLATATIPAKLNTQLMTHFPTMDRLASKNLHRLPRKLGIERVPTKGAGNPMTLIEKKLRAIFAETGRKQKLNPDKAESRAILFCNKSDKAREIGEHLEGAGLENIVVTGGNADRRLAKNQHLGPFLRQSSNDLLTLKDVPRASTSKEVPRILVTTSLLARGLDFSPTVSHVLIVDEPRNEIDFLHRAGRTGRAGFPGTVVVFGGTADPLPRKTMGFA